jgi:hypothetical protein
MLAVKDVSRLLAMVPKGAWVALSRDEERILGYSAELQDAIQKAKKAGENDPIVLRAPQAVGTTLIL